MTVHRPVMVEEVMSLLNIRSGARIVDGTLGHGGHARRMLEVAGRQGSLIGFDWDAEMLARAKESLEEFVAECQFVHADFRAIPAYLRHLSANGVDAVLLDLGVNIEHFLDAERGFSFSSDAKLDMRMDTSAKETAAAWLGRATEQQIVRALRELGGERHAGRIAKEIVRRRHAGGMKRTTDLVDAVLTAVPPRLREKRIHPATRTFQAVRIQVNRELEGLQEAIQNLAGCLNPGGRMAVLSYHSGEDSATKHAFKNLANSGEFRILTKTPLRPSHSEVEGNPSARSAKLRGLERLHREVIQ